MRIFSYCLLVTIFLLSSLITESGHAASSKWKKTTEISARVISGNIETIDDGRNLLHLGVHFTMAPDWKTYWKLPGDGGLPMSIDWQNSSNITNPVIHYPAPQRFVQFGEIETFAWKEEVVVPITVEITDINKPIQLNPKINYAACSEICLFFNEDFPISLKANEQDNTHHSLIQKFWKQIPTLNGTEGLHINRISHLNGNKLVIDIASANELKQPDIFVDAGADFRFPKPAISIKKDKNHATLTFTYEKLVQSINLEDFPLTLTLVNNYRAVETSLARIPQPGPEISKQNTITLKSYSTVQDPYNQGGGTDSDNSLLYIMFAAFLGGLILNIMPCVLPVLSIKLFGLMKHGGGKTSQIRASFLMSAAGIVTSFLVLAGIVIGLKAAGHAVGWGFHFQQPIFLIILVVILTIFAASQWGLTEMHLPSWLGGRIAGKNYDAHSPIGNFLTGAFATLMATPCSAPFLGTAISFALSRGSYEIALTFFVMGLGLASPYLLFAIAPKLVSAMPRPGAWMLKIRSLLGVFLAATAIWLIWVFSMQTNVLYASILSALSLLIITTFIVFRKKNLPAFALWSTHTVWIILALTLTTLPPTKAEPDNTQQTGNTIHWQNFSEKTLKEKRDEGKIIFVDVTADWCLTCKFNKANVLTKARVADKLNNGIIVPLLADYTSPSAEITAFLKRYNRYAIPFNIVYGPGAPEGIILPELLSEEAVLDALMNAAN